MYHGRYCKLQIAKNETAQKKLCGKFFRFTKYVNCLWNFTLKANATLMCVCVCLCICVTMRLPSAGSSLQVGSSVSRHSPGDKKGGEIPEKGNLYTHCGNPFLCIMYNVYL